MNAAAAVLVAAALVIWLAPAVVLVSVYLRERRDDRSGAPMVRAESLSERHDRLDAEALAANIAAFDRLGKEANR